METDGPLLIMERMIPPICRDGSLMYIHRGYFAKALLDYPKDPMRSPYAHSYLSAYRAALSMLKVVREHYNLFPNLASRFWSLWSHAFSATVIIGSIVIRGRNSDTARAALVELNLAVGLFEKAAQHADRAKRSLPTLLRLREKAYDAAKELDDVGMVQTDNKRVVVEGFDELMIFGGSTKLFDKDKIKKEHPEKHYEGEVQDVQPIKSASHIVAVAATASGTSDRSQSSADSSMFATPPQQQSDMLQGLMTLNGTSSAIPTSPPTPEDLRNGSGASFPPTWSAWSDQEAMLINYLSSGVDINAATNAAFANDADPMSFIWADVHANSPPDSQGSHSSPGDSQTHIENTQQQHQRAPSTSRTSLQDPNAFNIFSMNAPSSFAPPPPEMKAAFEAEFGNSAFQQAQQQQQQLSANPMAWEGLLWGGSAFY